MKKELKKIVLLTFAIVFGTVFSIYNICPVRAVERTSDNTENLSATITPTQAPEASQAPVPSQSTDLEATPSVSLPTASETITYPSQPSEIHTIVLSNRELTMRIGGSIWIIAMVEPNDMDVVWISQDESVAKVSSKGKVTAVGIGKTTVVAKVGTISMSCIVTVIGAAVECVYLEQSHLTITGTDVMKLTPTLYPDDADNKKVIWTSGDSSIATVDKNGYVRGYKNGKTTITVTTEEGGFTDTCFVTVTGNNITSVSLNISNCYLKVGNTYQLTASLEPHTAHIKDVTWSTTNSSIASVDNDGKVTARKEGCATITATSVNGGKKAECKVYVSSISVAEISLNKTDAIVMIGQPIALTASIFPEDATSTQMTWKSSNKAVATVSDNGIVSGVSYGNATITATIGDITASCNVSVRGNYDKKDYLDGARYQGELGNEKRNGEGTLIRADGTKIEGIWSNDQLISTMSTVTFPNGDIYEGCYNNFIKSGKGTYTTKSGTIIEGNWKQKKLTGKVTINYYNGDKFSGNFKNNKKNGQGTYTFANGDKYVGKWKNDKMNGTGKYTFKNGSFYKATFKNNKLSGKVNYNGKKGKRYRGVVNKTLPSIKKPNTTPVMK